MSGTDTAAMVGTRYDVVLDGYGFMFDKRPEVRAELTYTPTFLERQNTSGDYGDNEQDFFLTVAQHDWSVGEGQRFFRADDADSTSQFFYSTGVNTSVPGEFSFGWAVDSLTPTANILSSCGVPTSTHHYLVSSSNVYDFDGSSFTDLGAHGAGTPNKWGICVDRTNAYIAGATKIRSLVGGVFADFSVTTNAGALAFLNNALYSCDGTTLRTYDGSGTATTLFTWKKATNVAYSALSQNVRLLAHGATLYILFQNGGVAPELWEYDGDGTTLIATFPRGSVAGDMVESEGVTYISASIPSTGTPARVNAGTVGVVYAFVNGSLSELWRSEQINTAAPGIDGTHPVLGVQAGKLLIAEHVTATNMTPRIKKYDPATGSVTTVAEYSATMNGTGAFQFSSSLSTALLTFDNGASAKKAFMYPSSSLTTSGYLITSQFDFGNALTKQFRGVKIDSENGTVDIAYQTDGVGGTYTTLQASAASGTEYLFPANTTGRTVSLKLTLSAPGPYVKRIYVRAAPTLQSYRKATYILDLSGRNGKRHGVCHDGTNMRRDGLEQLAILRGLLGTTFTAVDSVGSFTATIDTGAFKADAVRPEEFVAVVPVREV